MLKPFYSPERGKLRVLGFISGSGNTLWKAYELSKTLEATQGQCPFEIVGVFSDNPNCSGIEFAKKENIPFETSNIKEFYAKKQKKISDLSVRAEFDQGVLDKIKKFDADIIILAGYVWAITDVILSNYMTINVHPADLSIMENDSPKYAGKDGVGDALRAKEDYIASSSHIAIGELDAGPILMISEKIPIDYSLHTDEIERFRYYLKQVNNQGRLIGAYTLLEIASGNFTLDETGRVHHKSIQKPQGIVIDNWDQYLSQEGLK